MASIFSRLRRLIPVARRRPVGYDLQGNKYFEGPGANGGRTKRTIEYRIERDITDYTSGYSRLPVQWTAWMAHTRTNPPTIEELERDYNRQTRLTPLISAIEEREKQERIRQGFLIPDSETGDYVPTPIAGPSHSRDSATRQQPSKEPRISSHSSFSEVEVDARRSVPEAETNTYPVPTPPSAGVAPSRSTVDPSTSPEELRRLSEKDTRRRMQESGVAEQTGSTGEAIDVTEGQGLKPRRRGGR
ncbi:NADH dehydrogenase [ubiquinone] 1 alpha subcomplex assembly factor 2, partial [Tremellales sp. Uapishka_1]